jgi:hypothetical protein
VKGWRLVNRYGGLAATRSAVRQTKKALFRSHTGWRINVGIARR